VTRVPPASLTERTPSVEPARALAELVVPPTFQRTRLAGFVPDPGHPSQAAGVTAVAEFAERVSARPTGRGWLRRRMSARAEGVYLDGGFGVGKTHLLAATANAVCDTAPSGGPGADSPVAFGTFMQYTALVGALGFAAARDALRGRSLVCIDEFELDDPGDTVLMSTLLGELAEAGVWLAATSNTLPGALGVDRFAAEDFVREIQGLAQRFSVVHIDGPDYRHREVRPAVRPLSATELDGWARQRGAAVDDFPLVLDHLARVHPAAYGPLLDGVTALAWRGVAALPDEAAALRLVVLVDRLYDRGIAVAGSGLALTEVFTASMLAGGYRKKYGRARSRLDALARPAAVPGPSAPGDPASSLP